MRHVRAIILILAAALAQGCSAVRVETDFDRTVDFTALETYRWIEHERDDEDNPFMRDALIRSHVRSAVDTALAAKGYARIESGRPDFLVAYYFTARNRVDVTHYAGYYWYPHTSVYRYKEGTLIVDIVDPEKKQLVWRGWATGMLHGREYAHDEINDSVRAMMKRFPPQPR
ncbi:MAG: DUF4136 domain-containing protein [Candidatus Krumholzibacteria bacterium]|nr:DUF4136 domain-containing protein [Candidatus Krumholzibacteria bacterium]